jgi:hypothetical protein
MNSGMPETSRLSLRSKGSDHPVEAEAIRIGQDVLVAIFGGERPHIGAVAAAAPRPSLADPTRTSATASVFTYVGHKEDEIAKYAAETLSASLAVHVVVTVGIHWDHIKPNEIKLVTEHCRELVDELKHRLGARAVAR